MARFTVRLYSDFGMVPQDQTKILFEANSLDEIKDCIKEYFKYEDYFNAVYFVDNELSKSGYVGRDLTIGCGESLEHFCGEPEPEPAPTTVNNLDVEDNYDTTIYNLAILLDLSYEDARKFYAAGIKELFFSHRGDLE
jgi:hypothetical protein